MITRVQIIAFKQARILRGRRKSVSETGYCLGLHCGITFAGLKPASLFWLKDGQDKDMVYYRRCFAKKDFRFIAVKRSAGRNLFYVFLTTLVGFSFSNSLDIAVLPDAEPPQIPIIFIIILHSILYRILLKIFPYKYVCSRLLSLLFQY